MTLNFILFVTLLLLWLIPNLYFLYSLERRKPWALEIASMLASTDAVTRGTTQRLGSNLPKQEDHRSQITPMFARPHIWTNWL